MNKVFLVFALILVSSYSQLYDWKTCADSIIKLEVDIVDFASFVQDAVEVTFIPDVKKIIEECKFGKINDWANCASAVLTMGDDLVIFGKKVEDTVKNVFIKDVVAIKNNCKKEQIDQSINDWPTCLEDISKIVDLASKIAQDIKQFNFVQLVKDIQELYTTVQKAIQDCTKSTKKLQSSNDWPQCIEDIGKIVEIAGKISDDIKKLDFVSLIKDIQDLYNIVQQAIKDCTKQKLELAEDNDWPTCLQDITQIVALVNKVVADIKQFKFDELVKDITSLYALVQKAIKDCTQSKQLLELSPNDWPQCVEDIGKIVEIAGKISDDIKKLDFVSLIKDIQDLYNIVQQAIKDCTKQKLELAEDNDWPTCLQDITQIVALVNKVVADIKQFKFDELVKDITSLYALVQKAIKDCTQSEQLLQLSENDWPQCVEDIGKIVEIAGKISDDIKKLDFVSLIKDIQDLYNIVQQAIKDCTKQQEQDWPTCLEDIGKIVELAGKIVDDVKKLDFAALIKDVQELYNVVQNAIKDCTQQKLIEQQGDNDWAQCLDDIQQIVKLVDAIQKDIKHFNFAQLVKDVNALYQLVQKALKDCTKK